MKWIGRGTRCLVVALVLGWSGVVPAQAQDEPVVIGRREKLPSFDYTTPYGNIFVIGEYSHDSSDGPNSSSETTQWLFKEGITLSTDAYIYHPNFLQLLLNGQFELNQTDFKSDTEEDRTDSTLYLWDVQALFLREQPYNLTLYTSRTQNVVDRAFAESFRTTYTVYGAFVNLQDKTFPTTIRIYRQEQEQDTLGGSEDFSLYENILEWYTEYEPTTNQRLSLSYRLDLAEQSSAGGISDDYTSQSAALGHTVNFGPSNLYSLSSTLIYSDVTGNFSNRNFMVDELLDLQHTIDFETEYRYLYDRQETSTSDRTLQRGNALFRHQLYESLYTIGQIGASQLEINDASTTTEYFGKLTFNYDKQVPYGELLGTLDLGYNYRETNESTSPLQIIDQPFFFSGFNPILIPGQTIEISSIVITSVINQIYLEGIDYTLTQRLDGVQVDRVIGGAIPADSTVLIDYIILPVPDTQINTAATGITLRYNILQGPLTGLSPYVRLAAVEQDVSGGGGIIKPDSPRDYLLGLEYRVWSLILTGEYEVYDSDLVPYNATRFIARLNHRVSGDTILSGNASYTLIDYTDSSQQTQTINATLAATHRLTPRLYVTGSLGWADVDDSIGGHTQGLQETLELFWRLRQVEVFARARNSNRSTEDEDFSFQYVEVGIRRDF